MDLLLWNEKWLKKLMLLQGTIVDRIDYNIQSVATTVEEGLKQLQKVLFFLTFLNYYFCKILLSLCESVHLSTFVLEFCCCYKHVINLLEHFTYRQKEHRKKEGWLHVQQCLLSCALSC